MLTDFGKALRKMRIDHGEFLRDMAAKLNVTVAYLSAVENGRREVPDNWIGELANQYKLSNEEQKELQEYAFGDSSGRERTCIGVCKNIQKFI